MEYINFVWYGTFSYPSTKINLVIDEDTVTKNVEKTITKQYQEREMYSYYLMRYGWTLRVFLDIKWEAVNMVNRKFQYDPFFTKLSQGILPTCFSFISITNMNHHCVWHVRVR